MLETIVDALRSEAGEECPDCGTALAGGLCPQCDGGDDGAEDDEPGEKENIDNEGGLLE